MSGYEGDAATTPARFAGDRVRLGDAGYRLGLRYLFLIRRARLMCDRLGVSDIGPDENFFVLGGNSLSATELLRSIAESHGVDLPPPAFFRRPTVAGLAEQIKLRLEIPKHVRLQKQVTPVPP